MGDWLRNLLQGQKLKGEVSDPFWDHEATHAFRRLKRLCQTRVPIGQDRAEVMQAIQAVEAALERALKATQ